MDFNNFCTNCGGFALQKNMWYIPSDNMNYGYDIQGYLEDYDELTEEKDAIFQQLIKNDIQCILDDNPYLEKVNYNQIDWSKRVVAYRICLDEDFNYDNYNYDFHFKYWNGKCWAEKCGEGNIHHCDLDNWFYDYDYPDNKDKDIAEREGDRYREYNSDTIFFQYKYSPRAKWKKLSKDKGRIILELVNV